MYRVKRAFFDKKDNNKPYNAGAMFEGTDKRVSELIDKGYLAGEKPKNKKKSNDE